MNLFEITCYQLVKKQILSLNYAKILLEIKKEPKNILQITENTEIAPENTLKILKDFKKLKILEQNQNIKLKNPLETLNKLIDMQELIPPPTPQTQTKKIEIQAINR